jgi:hypothetical protein
LLANAATQATGLATTFAVPLALVIGVILFVIGVNYAIGWTKRAGKAKA